METVTLAKIAMKFTPDLVPFLTDNELNTSIVLRDGMDLLDEEGAMEIVHFSIYEYQRNLFIH